MRGRRHEAPPPIAPEAQPAEAVDPSSAAQAITTTARGYGPAFCFMREISRQPPLEEHGDQHQAANYQRAECADGQNLESRRDPPAPLSAMLPQPPCLEGRHRTTVAR